ncbi:MAG: hypothetical protein ACPGPF_04355 [Pontibacterium sp.]
MAAEQYLSKDMLSELLNYSQAERPILGAPLVSLDTEEQCIPQHFLEYQHTYESVWEVVNDISFCPKYPVFVCEEKGCIYIQIGVIGYDNYSATRASDNKHIVYGRKWRVEPNLPSCEIIQTVFLALQKAREHELRELLCLKSALYGKQSTPFSGHHDIPVMASRLSHQNTSSTTEQTVESVFSRLSFDTLPVIMNSIEDFSHGTVLTFTISSGDTPNNQPILFPELINRPISMVLSKVNADSVMHGVMKAIIQASNDFVAEHFQYRGFARFSESHPVDEMGDLSIMLRNKAALSCPDFVDRFKNTNFAVDSTRAPRLSDTRLASRVLESLNNHHTLTGHLPVIKVD